MSVIHLGEEFSLSVVPPGDSRLVWFDDSNIYVSAHSNGDRNIKLTIKRWQEREAKSYLVSRVRVLSEQTGLHARKISFRNQRSRWGSCNETGDISLNIRLIQLPVELIDYVLIHELAHTIHLNHSRHFWDLVNQHCPGAREVDRTLKRWTVQFTFRGDILLS